MNNKQLKEFVESMDNLQVTYKEIGILSRIVSKTKEQEEELIKLKKKIFNTVGIGN